MEHKEYNGWYNYETWLVKLWFDNEQPLCELQKEWAQQAKDTPKNEVWTREETTRFTLADIFKNYVEEEAPDATQLDSVCVPSGMFSDLISAALSEVNWQEIADNILSEY